VLAPDLARATLERLLREAQRIGMLGARPIPEVIAHAESFVAALPDNVRTVVDLGTGAGVPGLILAVARPHLRVTMVDRREKRTDFVHRAIRALDLHDTARVVCADVETLTNDRHWMGSFDAAVSRGFTAPYTTVLWAARLVRPGGWVLVSEPPATAANRWEPRQLAAIGVSTPTRHGAVAVFHVEHRDPSGGTPTDPSRPAVA
jgi:16S rRNA (guanine527-N7)-methyltransferase